MGIETILYEDFLFSSSQNVIAKAVSCAVCLSVYGLVRERRRNIDSLTTETRVSLSHTWSRMRYLV